VVECDFEVWVVMSDVFGEEYKYFLMDFEFLLWWILIWCEIVEGVLFKEGDIVEYGEEVEVEVIGDEGDDFGGCVVGMGDGLFGIGSL